MFVVKLMGHGSCITGHGSAFAWAVGHGSLLTELN